MRRLAAIVGVALAGVLAMSGVASAARKPTLKLEVGGEALAPEAPVTTTSSDLVLRSGEGQVTCSNAVWSGRVLTNSQVKSDLLDPGAASFGGEGAEGRCLSTYPAPLDELEVSASIGTLILLAKKGEAEIKEQVSMGIAPVEKPTGGHGAVSCSFTTKNIKNLPFPTNGEPLTVKLTAHLRVDPNSAHECGNVGGASLSATLTFSSGGQPVTAVRG